MKKSLLALALVAASAAASAAPSGFYAGARLGQHMSDSTRANVNELSDGGAMAEVFVGRRIGHGLAVEATVSKLGMQDMQRGALVGESTANALSLEAVYTKPLCHHVALTAEAGVAYTTVNMVGKTADRLTPVVGLGLTYPLSKATSLDMRWKHYYGVGDAGNRADTLTMGVSFKF